MRKRRTHTNSVERKEALGEGKKEKEINTRPYVYISFFINVLFQSIYTLKGSTRWKWLKILHTRRRRGRRQQRRRVDGECLRRLQLHTFLLSHTKILECVSKMTFYKKTEILSSWRETKSDLSIYFIQIIQFCPPSFNYSL